MSRHLRAAIIAGAAAIAGLVIAAALVSPNHQPSNPTPTGYRPTLVCDYAVTSSQCPQLSIPYATPTTVRPRATVPPRPTSTTRAPVPRTTARR
jgi:hypothetical protein